jgi:uncharacterized membrane protein
MNKILQDQRSSGQSSFDSKRAAAMAASRNKRSLEDFEDFEAREPVFGAIYDIATTGAARRVVTAPLRQTAQDAANQHPSRSGPGPAQAAMNRILQDQRSSSQSTFDSKRAAAMSASRNKRSLENEDLEAREPVFGAIYDIATTGASRRVVTAPLRQTAMDAINRNPIHSGPGPAQAAMSKILADQRAASQAQSQSFDNRRAAAHAASRNKRSLEYLEAREPVFGAIYDIATTGAARRVVTAPLKQTVQDAATQHPAHYGPGPAQAAMNRILQENKSSSSSQSYNAQRAAAHAASRNKRDLEDLLERDEFDLD